MVNRHQGSVRGVLWIGIVALVAAGVALMMWIPAPNGTPVSSREVGGALVGLVVLVVAVLGPDWRDWF